MSFSNKTAIAGVGATEFSKNSGRSEMQLAAEAVTAALEDAGLTAADVQGFSTYTMDNNSELELARTIGAGNLTFFSRTHFGGHGACAPLLQAAMAVHSGIADVVVCYRAMNERSEYRFGQPMQTMMPTAENVLMALHINQGLATAGAWMGMCMKRYMHETGTTSEDFGHLAVASRKHAATNPNAFFYGKPITHEEYMHSRMIADPLRLFDFCQESDGAVAVVVVSAERAKTLRQKPVLIRGAAQGSPREMMALSNFYKPDIAPYEEVELVGKQLYKQSGLSPKDIQVAIIYDHFLPSVMPALEALGFCARGEGKDFVKGGNIEVGGGLPVNTHGGQVGEAYIHGMNGVAEAVRQVRGTAINQVRDVENIVVTAGSGGPMSGVILGVA